MRRKMWVWKVNVEPIVKYFKMEALEEGVLRILGEKGEWLDWVSWM